MLLDPSSTILERVSLCPLISVISRTSQPRFEFWECKITNEFVRTRLVTVGQDVEKRQWKKKCLQSLVDTTEGTWVECAEPSGEFWIRVHKRSINSAEGKRVETSFELEWLLLWLPSASHDWVLTFSAWTRCWVRTSFLDWCILSVWSWRIVYKHEHGK